MEEKRMKAYFSYDPNGDGFCRHDTADAAKDAAEQALEYEKKEAKEGWSEEVTGICWGKLCQGIKELSRRPVTEEDCCCGTPDYDEIVEFGLVELES
jgi:hypothetical protein